MNENLMSTVYAVGDNHLGHSLMILSVMGVSVGISVGLEGTSDLVFELLRNPSDDGVAIVSVVRELDKFPDLVFE